MYICMYIYIYRRAKGIYIPKSCNLQHMDSFSLCSLRLNHGFYTRWLHISLCAHIEYLRHFDLLKAFGYIERVVKHDFFLEKSLFCKKKQ